MPLTPDDLERLIADDLARRQVAGQLRSRRTVEPLSSTRVRVDGVEYVNFASNNYLGLTHHPRVRTAVEVALHEFGLGSGAAALITGHTPRHASAERAIARWKGTQDAVLLPSGYQANHAAIQALAAIGGQRQGGVRFLLDKLAHASLVDAVRGTGANFRVFPHNHLPKIERLLAEAPPDQLQVVVTESIFSMDGDAADLAGLAQLKQRAPFILLLDEAHGSGAYGAHGAGYAAEQGLQQAVDVTVVTLSKALGCAGGAVCGSSNFVAAVLNYGRAFIYSTNVPPLLAAAAEEAIEVMRTEPERQQRLRALSMRVRDGVTKSGFEIPPGDSPIVPVIVGDEAEALAASRLLADRGLLVPAVRPPTVPKGSARLRVTLSCDHADADVDRLLAAIGELNGF